MRGVRSAVGLKAYSIHDGADMIDYKVLYTRTESPQAFIAMINEHRYRPRQVERGGQRVLVSPYVAGDRKR